MAMELGNMPTQALDQDLNQLTTRIFNGVSDLCASLPANSRPDILLRDVLGLGEEQIAALPRYLLGFTALWLVCGGITLFLHFKKGQRSLNPWSHQAANIIFTLADFLLVPLLVVVVKLGRQLLSGVTPYSGELSDAWRFFTEAWGVLFDPVLLFAVLLFTILLPVQAAIRYLKVYRLAGLPHMIFDVGTGIYLACAALLSMLLGTRRWYLLLVPALILLCAAQTGGYVSSARNAREADPPEAEARTPEDSAPRQ